jgi:hypothetical protein
LRQIPDLEIPEDVRSTLDKWADITNENVQNFGFVILDNTGKKPVIACWATIDFIANGFGDLGFFYPGGLSLERVWHDHRGCHAGTWL